MKLSVIVPIYNVEQYLPQCLDSLNAQTLKDMEVLLVDDGSTDSSNDIAKAYVQQNPERFRLFYKQNGGLSDARNYAIPYAKGEYLAFLDSDDWVEPELYEKMLACMDEDTDVCLTDIEYWWEDPAKRYVMKGLSDWKADSIQKKALLSPLFAWNKVYRTELFQEEDGYRYPLNTWYEDIPVTTLLEAKAKKITYLPECLIHYRQREGSIMSSKDDPRLENIFSIMELVREEFEDAGLDQKYHDELEYLHAEHLRLYGMFRFIRSEHWQQYYDESERVMLACYPQWKHNRYLKNLNGKNRLFLQIYGKATASVYNRKIRNTGD